MSELVIDDPYLETTYARRNYATEGEIDAALELASAQTRPFAALSLEQRTAMCEAALVALAERGDVICRDITKMMGKPLGQAKGELAGMAARARHMMSIAQSALGPELLPAKDGFLRRIERVPLGVVFNMPAWNYPLLTCVSALFPALLAGNTVVIKHSDRTALVAEHFAAAFQSAGAQPGVVTAIHTDHPGAARIAADPRVKHVAFTGSVAGGRAIYAATASGHFADAGLELGGNDAAYIAEDVNVESVAASIVEGACYNAGQSCCAVERVYVHGSIHDAFVQAVLAEMQKLRLGDPTAEEIDMGPMAQPSAIDTLKRHVDSARAAGAKVLCGGKATRKNGTGRFFEPTLLAGVTQDMPIMQEESFGPLLPIMAVSGDEQARQRINDSNLGLTASIWTQDVERAQRLAAHLEVGTVYMNQCDSLDPALPWTGTKLTGKGCTLSRHGYSHLTRLRSINFKLS